MWCGGRGCPGGLRSVEGGGRVAPGWWWWWWWVWTGDGQRTPTAMSAQGMPQIHMSFNHPFPTQYPKPQSPARAPCSTPDGGVHGVARRQESLHEWARYEAARPRHADRGRRGSSLLRVQRHTLQLARDDGGCSATTHPHIDHQSVLDRGHHQRRQWWCGGHRGLIGTQRAGSSPRMYTCMGPWARCATALRACLAAPSWSAPPRRRARVVRGQVLGRQPDRTQPALGHVHAGKEAATGWGAGASCASGRTPVWVCDCEAAACPPMLGAFAKHLDGFEECSLHACMPRYSAAAAAPVFAFYQRRTLNHLLRHHCSHPATRTPRNTHGCGGYTVDLCS